MKLVNFFHTSAGESVRLIEKALSDNSIVYDIEIIEDRGTGDLLMTVAATDKKDAYRRFDLLKKALSA